jgi:2-hydroxyglutarate dehydrogenase
LFQLIVATEPDEIPRLDVLHEKGLKNKVRDLRVVGPDEIREIEPNCRVSPLHNM